MSLLDAHGLALSTHRVESLAAYEQALDELHSAHGDPLCTIERALAADAGFVMGHAMRAALLVMAADESVEADLAASVRAGEVLAHTANERERRHIAAARAWLERDLVLAIERYGDIVIDHPHDSLALRVAHFGDFQLGQTRLLRDRVARALPAWDAAAPHYRHMLGMHAFGLEESGHYGRAEQVGRLALQADPRNPGAIHAVTHVMEMQGRAHDGIEWLNATAPQWSASGYALHHGWHLALFHLELDDAAGALHLYDRHLRPAPPLRIAALVDASSLLWRLGLHGVDVGARWREVADGWEARRIGGLRPFNDVHAMLAFVADRRIDRARLLLQELRDCAARSRALDRAIHDAALPVCEALLAFGRGDHADAVQRLTRLRHLALRCGGSVAQCDLLHLTLLEAALRSRQHRLARALIVERRTPKPASRLNRRLQARAERQAGTTPTPGALAFA